jgi:DNA-binding response OmpR family regulator
LVVVEDDDRIAGSLQHALQGAGYSVRRVATVAEAEVALGSADAALIDLALLDGDGVELCRRSKQRTPNVPVIALSAHNDEVSTVDALDAGADDYITMPFRPAELLARVRAQLRRAGAGVTESDGVRLEAAARLAWLDGNPLQLTTKQFDLLEYLVDRAGSTVCRTDIMADVWDAHWRGSTRTLDFHITTLRTKLASSSTPGDLIHTVKGFGYRFGR